MLDGKIQSKKKEEVKKLYVKGFENPRAKSACHLYDNHVCNTGFRLLSKVETNQPSTPKQLKTYKNLNVAGECMEGGSHPKLLNFLRPLLIYLSFKMKLTLCNS